MSVMQRQNGQHSGDPNVTLAVVGAETHCIPTETPPTRMGTHIDKILAELTGTVAKLVPISDLGRQKIACNNPLLKAKTVKGERLAILTTKIPFMVIYAMAQIA